MITIEEKLSVFTNLVLEKVQNEYDEQQKQLNIVNKRRIQEYKINLEKEREKIINEMVKNGETEKCKRIAKAKLEKKRKVLSKRQELIERQVEDIKNRAYAFTDKKEYRNFLKNILFEVLANFKNDEGIILYLTKKDIRRHALFLLHEGKNQGFSEKNIEILPYREEIIGGMIGLNQDKTFRIDLSMKTRIEENRQLIGKRLYEAFKVGGFNE